MSGAWQESLPPPEYGLHAAPGTKRPPWWTHPKYDKKDERWKASPLTPRLTPRTDTWRVPGTGRARTPPTTEKGGGRARSTTPTPPQRRVADVNPWASSERLHSLHAHRTERRKNLQDSKERYEAELADLLASRTTRRYGGDAAQAAGSRLYARGAHQDRLRAEQKLREEYLTELRKEASLFNRNPRVLMAKKAAAHTKTYDRLYQDATQRRTRLDDLTYESEKKEMEMLEAMKWQKPETSHFDYDAYYRQRFQKLEDEEQLDEEEEEEREKKTEDMLKHRQFEYWKWKAYRRQQLVEEAEFEKEATLQEPTIFVDPENSEIAMHWWREHLGIAQESTWAGFLSAVQDDRAKLDVGTRLFEDSRVRQRKRENERREKELEESVMALTSPRSLPRKAQEDDPELLAAFDRLHLGSQEYVRTLLNNAAAAEAEAQEFAGGDFADWLRVLLAPSREANDFADALLADDDDGQLDFVEFETVCRDRLRIPSTDVTSRELRNLFKVVSQGDNRISREELVEFMVLRPEDYKDLVKERKEERQREEWRTRNLWDEDPPHLRMSTRSGISFWEGRFGQSAKERNPDVTSTWLHNDANVRRDRLKEKRHEQKMEAILTSEYGGKTPVSPEIAAGIGQRMHLQGDLQARKIFLAAAVRYCQGQSLREVFLAQDDLQLGGDDFRTLIRDTLEVPEEGNVSISAYDVKKMFKAIDSIDTERNNIVTMSQIVWYLEQTQEESPRKRQPSGKKLRPMKFNFYGEKRPMNPPLERSNQAGRNER